jgi:hypothetical protein
MRYDPLSVDNTERLRIAYVPTSSELSALEPAMPSSGTLNGELLVVHIPGFRFGAQMRRRPCFQSG